jgi:plasmid stabilization system protein ParE
MQNYSLKINKSVYNFLQRLQNYIFNETQNIKTSEKVIDSILEKFNLLQDFPEIYQKFDKNYRVMTIDKKFRIFFKINKKYNSVVIHKIYSTSQNYSKYLK